MTAVSSLKSYSDIRRFVPFETFRAATTYISWHNRLTMTNMLEVWEALVVAFVFEQKFIDEFLYTAVKGYLDRTREDVPATVEDCRTRAGDLINTLFPKS